VKITLQLDVVLRKNVKDKETLVVDPQEFAVVLETLINRTNEIVDIGEKEYLFIGGAVDVLKEDT
jgi:hypothetical protein